MEIIVASSIGVLTAGGVYLLLRLRTFPVILGLALLSYAVNVFLFASGRLAIDQSPILSLRRGDLYRPAAAGAGADGDRDLLRDDGGAGDDRRSARSGGRQRPDRHDPGTGTEDGRRPEGARMMHWIILPGRPAGHAGAAHRLCHAPRHHAGAHGLGRGTVLLLAIALGLRCWRPTARPMSTGWATGPRPSASCWCSTGCRR
jgi:hypothetical protein